MIDELDWHKNPDLAADMAVNSIFYFLNGLDMDSQEKRRWVNRVFIKVLSRIGIKLVN